MAASRSAAFSALCGFSSCLKKAKRSRAAARPVSLSASWRRSEAEYSGLAETVVGKIGGQDVGRLEFLALRQAESGIMTAQDVINRVGEPCLMAKLEAGAQRARGSSERKSSSSTASALRLGGNWKSTAPSLPAAASGSTEARNRFRKSVVSFRRRMWAIAMRLDAEAKPRRSLRQPVL